MKPDCAAICTPTAPRETHCAPQHRWKLRLCVAFTMTLIMLFILNDSTAQPLAEVGHYGENIGTVAIDGNKGVFNEGTLLRVMDLSLFSPPQFRGAIDLGAIPYSTQVVGSYVYCVCRTGKFYIIDISNSFSPYIVGQADWIDWKAAIWVRRSGDYAYVTGCSGVHIIDVRNKSNPIQLGLLAGPCTNAITGDGGYLYVPQSSYNPANTLLEIYHLADPRNPVLIGKEQSAQPIISHNYNGVAVFGDTLYLASRNETFVMDISDRTAPYIKNTIAITEHNGPSLDISNGILHAAVQGRTFFHNLATPNAPAFLQELSGPTWFQSSDVAAVDNLSFSARTDSLRLTDQNSGSIQTLRTLTPNFTNAEAMARSGNILFVGTGTRIAVLDISQPTQPVLLSIKECSYTGRFAVQGTNLYNVSLWSTIEIFDITNPYNLVKKPATLPIPGPYAQRNVSFVLKNDVAAVTAGNQVLLYNIASNGNLVQQSTINLPTTQNAVDINGTIMYVAQYNGNVSVYNIANRTNPQLISNRNAFSSTAQGGGIQCIIDGNRLHTFFGRKGYALYNISSATNPTLLGSIPLPTKEGPGMSVSGNYVYMALYGWMGQDGIVVLDTSNPGNIRIAHSQNATDYSCEVHLHNGYAYYTEGRGGLRIRNLYTPTSGLSDWSIY